MGPIGVDLDNTIIDHGPLVERVAREMGLLEGPPAGKRSVRDTLRAGPGGDLAWQRVQAEVYGPRLRESLPFPGAREFFCEAHRKGARLAIVSHKTQFARLDPRRTDLRAAAMAWLDNQGFLGHATGMTAADVHFEPTRDAKVARIRELGCSHFVDDLEETFQTPGFPLEVTKLLFDPDSHPPVLPGVHRVSSWKEASALVFGLGTPP